MEETGCSASSWLVSTLQVSGAPDMYIYNCIRIITSILPRQEEREKQRNASVRVPGWTSERVTMSEGETSEGTREEPEPGEHKRERVRGGCLGAEGRRRTRRPAKRSRGAACERRSLRIRMGQPIQSDVWISPAE